MSIHIDHTAAFAQFWVRTFPGVPCPPVPKKLSELNMTAQMTMRAEDPKLFQNLFAGNTSTLPADVAHRRTLGENTIADADALERCGLQHEADELRRRANYAEAERMSQRIDESRQVQQQAAQRREEWQSMGILARMVHTPIDPAVAAANRRKWGIKGR